MITLRKARDRGHFDHGWLDTWHTFSFADYQDPAHMGFRKLRVLNEDTVLAGQGFGRHGHRDMEILTYVLSGALEHEDSTGGGGVLRSGDVQRMSAGAGVMHSEFNASKEHPVHFLQIWILPDRRGAPARYDDRNFPEAERKNQLCLIASPDGAGRSLSIYQDARAYAAILDAGREVTLELAPGRHAWVQVARGRLTLGNGLELEAGDGAAASEEKALTLKTGPGCEFLVFDLP
jgi:quercetin 2,3-dioxygenase